MPHPQLARQSRCPACIERTLTAESVVEGFELLCREHREILLGELGHAEVAAAINTLPELPIARRAFVR
jgi:hypothetical protein